jgi:hypothetical protein
MARGIGSYYSEDMLQPVGPVPSGARPVHHVSGLGAYYAPNTLRPIPPTAPGFQEVKKLLDSSAGLGSDTRNDGTKAFAAIVALLALGYFFLYSGKALK